MKKILFVIASLVVFASCGKDTEIEYRDVLVHDTVTVKENVTEYVNVGANFDSKPFVVSKSDTVIINYGDIEIGDLDNDIVFEMNSTIMDPKLGRITTYTLNCVGIGAVPLITENDTMKVNPEQSVQNVTIINRGKITIHTSKLFEKYKDLIQLHGNADRKYQYLRVLPIYAGKNSKVINEGVIEAYFDHDETTLSTVYVMALVSGDGSEIVNSGEIHFHGKGSPYTRMRGVATFADNITVTNDGIMTADVELAEDSRGVTTGGTYSNVTNNGTIDFNLTGSIFGLTRYGNSNIVNNGTIKLNSRNMPEAYKDEIYRVCALYDPLTTSREGGLPTITNRGNVTITLDNSGVANPNRFGYGVLVDNIEPASSSAGVLISTINVNVENTGIIKTDNGGSSCYNGELGVISWNNTKAIANVSVSNWKTLLRDFGTSKDLFTIKGANLSFANTKFYVVAGDGYEYGTAYSVAPENLVNITGTESGFSGKIVDDLDASNFSPINYQKERVVYDKDNTTVALTKVETNSK